MGVRYPTLTPLTRADVPAVTETPPVFAVSYSGVSYEVPYTVFPEEVNFLTITQAGHAFVVGDAVRKTTTAEKVVLLVDWVLAQATDDANGQAIGIVTAIGTGDLADTFIVQFNGQATIGAVAAGRYPLSLQPGKIYYLDVTTAGNGVTTTPEPNAWSKPLFYAVSETLAIIIDDRGANVSSTRMIEVSTTAPGQMELTVGMAVRFDTDSWVPSVASSAATAAVHALVAKIVNDKYYLVTVGVADIGDVTDGVYEDALTPGATYYLSASTAGLCEAVEPAPGSVVMAVFVALSTTRVLRLSTTPVSASETAYIEFIQATPALTVGMAVYLDSAGVYRPASNTTEAAAQAVGLIIAKPATNTYRLAHTGLATIGGVVGGVYSAEFTTMGQIRYVDTNGGTTATKPTTAGIYSKPMFVVMSGTQVLIIDDRPQLATDADSIELLTYKDSRGDRVSTHTITMKFGGVEYYVPANDTKPTAPCPAYTPTCTIYSPTCMKDRPPCYGYSGCPSFCFNCNDCDCDCDWF